MGSRETSSLVEAGLSLRFRVSGEESFDGDRGSRGQLHRPLSLFFFGFFVSLSKPRSSVDRVSRSFTSTLLTNLLSLLPLPPRSRVGGRAFGRTQVQRQTLSGENLKFDVGARPDA